LPDIATCFPSKLRNAELFQDGPESSRLDFDGRMTRKLGDPALKEDLGVPGALFKGAPELA
jgi:hypothetical protein